MFICGQNSGYFPDTKEPVPKDPGTARLNTGQAYGSGKLLK